MNYFILFFLALFFSVFGIIGGLSHKNREKSNFVKKVNILLFLLVICMVLITISSNLIQLKIYTGLIFVIFCIFGSYLITIGIKGGVWEKEEQKFVPKDTNDLGS